MVLRSTAIAGLVLIKGQEFLSIDPSKTDKSLVLESNQFKGHKKTITHKTSVLALNEITVDSGVFSKDIKLEIYLNDAFLKEY